MEPKTGKRIVSKGAYMRQHRASRAGLIRLLSVLLCFVVAVAGCTPIAGCSCCAPLWMFSRGYILLLLTLLYGLSMHQKPSPYRMPDSDCTSGMVIGVAISWK